MKEGFAVISDSEQVTDMLLNVCLLDLVLFISELRTETSQPLVVFGVDSTEELEGIFEEFVCCVLHEEPLALCIVLVPDFDHSLAFERDIEAHHVSISGRVVRSRR